MQTTALPTLFLSHGSPMIALEPGPAGRFMQALAPALVQRHGRPRAVLVASAHGLTREPVLLAGPQHHALYDFGGFDPRLNTLRYDAPGAPALATRALALLHATGLPGRSVDAGGLDHGIWTPLRHLFPEADIPVLPLAWPAHWTPGRLFALGAALAPLAAEGVLIIGSGSITHNLQRVFAQGRFDAGQPATPEALAFTGWFAERAAAADWSALFDWQNRAPHAALMHPTDEHLLPWFVAAGAGGGAPGVRLHASVTHAELAMDAYAFGADAALAAMAAEAAQAAAAAQATLPAPAGSP